MSNQVHIYHHHLRGNPKKQKPEGFWKEMGKLAAKEAGLFGRDAVKAATDIGSTSIHAMAMQEPPKKKKKRRF